VVASIFEQVDADILVMVDGDDTYEAGAVHQLLDTILKGDADTTSATRLHTYTENPSARCTCSSTGWSARHQLDVQSRNQGRVLRLPARSSREAASLIPITSRGFDVETELTLQALYRGLVLKEIPRLTRNGPWAVSPS